MKFTDRKLTGLKPKQHAYDIREADGFVVRVYPSSRKVFQYVYRHNGKQHRKTIGEFPHVYTLAEAREKHRDLIRQREHGEFEKPVLTYSEVYEQYIAKYQSTYADLGAEFRRIHEKDILLYMGNILVTELSKTNILFIQTKKKGTPRQANITVEKISRVCRYAVGLGLVEYNICADFPKLPENSPRQTVLTSEEMRDIYQAKDGSTIDGYLWAMLCTGMRGGEVKASLGALASRWVDVEQRKGGKVSVKAVYVPVTVRRLKLQRLSDKTSLAMLTRKKGKRYTPHDCRRTAATLLAGLGYDDYLIDRWLGHSVGKLKATYIVTKRETELRRMTIMLNRHILKLCRK